MLLAFDDVPGAPFDAPGTDVSDDLLRAIWEQVAIMRAHRIAHRDLRHTNVVVDATGQPWMVNLGFGEVGVADAPLEADVAELLCAIALMTGAERAVDSAIDGIGIDALGGALPACSSTRSARAPAPPCGATRACSRSCRRRSPRVPVSSNRHSCRSRASTARPCSRS